MCWLICHRIPPGESMFLFSVWWFCSLIVASSALVCRMQTCRATCLARWRSQPPTSTRDDVSCCKQTIRLNLPYDAVLPQWCRHLAARSGCLVTASPATGTQAEPCACCECFIMIVFSVFRLDCVFTAVTRFVLGLVFLFVCLFRDLRICLLMGAHADCEVQNKCIDFMQWQLLHQT